jgi:hypothetical protein
MCTRMRDLGLRVPLIFSAASPTLPHAPAFSTSRAKVSTHKAPATCLREMGWQFKKPKADSGRLRQGCKARFKSRISTSSAAAPARIMRPVEPRFLRRLPLITVGSGNNPGNKSQVVVERQSERREHCPVADFKLPKNVMEVHLDGAIGNIQPARNFLVR